MIGGPIKGRKEEARGINGKCCRHTCVYVTQAPHKYYSTMTQCYARVAPQLSVKQTRSTPAELLVEPKPPFYSHSKKMSPTMNEGKSTNHSFQVGFQKESGGGLWG